MPGNRDKFHNFALSSALFKGRSDWYFCFLKTERIAHALSVLAGAGEGRLGTLSDKAALVPADIAYMAAGEVGLPSVLASIFALLAEVRFAAARGFLSPENAAVLAYEYEQVAERLVRGSNPSPFLTEADFGVPALRAPELQAPPASPDAIKDTISDIKDNKSMSYRITAKSKGQTPGSPDRARQILEYLRKQKTATVGDISKVIRGCSEKTIQRELVRLIERGLIRKEGERRWSTYVAIR